MFKLLCLDTVSLLIWKVFHLQGQVEQNFCKLKYILSLLLPSALSVVYKNEKVKNSLHFSPVTVLEQCHD